MKFEKYLPYAHSLFERCFTLKQRSRFLIVSDKATQVMGDFFYHAALTFSPEVLLVQLNGHSLFSGFTGQVVRDSLDKADNVIFVFPDLAPPALPGWLEESQKTHILCVNVLQPQHLQRLIRQNFQMVIRRTQKFSDLLRIGKELKIGFQAGGELKLPISGARTFPDFSEIRRGRRVCFLPAGEVRILFENKKITGTFPVHFIAGEYTNPDQDPAMLLIKGGKIIQVKGKSELAGRIRKFFKVHGSASRTLLEIGIATNEFSEYGKSAAEDRKVLGGMTLTAGIRKSSKKEHQATYLTMVTLIRHLAIDNRDVIRDGRLMLS